MFRYICTMMMLSAMTLQWSHAYSIEDEDLIIIDDIRIAMLLDQEQLMDERTGKACTIVGKEMPLSINQEEKVFFLTTDACGWGASRGPIWLVKRRGGSTALIYKSFGNSLDKEETIHHDLYDISSISASGGVITTRIYQFDGEEYQFVSSEEE